MKTKVNQPKYDPEIIKKILYLSKYLDLSLVPINRFIFFRLLACYGFKEIPIQDLKLLAKQIDIHHTKLQKALQALTGTGILVDTKGGMLEVSPSCLKHVQIILDKKIDHPQFRLFVQLFNLLFQVKISHKQKKAQELLKLNYQQWLLLLHLLWLSDAHGVVFEADTHYLGLHTGLKRNALLRAITALFQCGLLRSKLNGTLNSNLLHSMSAIYFLNLSHPIWQDERRYAEYYIVRFPSGYQSICQQAFSSLQSMFEQQNSSTPFDLSNNHIYALVNETNHQTYHLAPIHLVDELAVYVQQGKHWDPNFLEHLQLLLSTFKNHHTKLNTVRDNVQRMNFLLHDYLTQKIRNFGQMQQFPAYADYQMLSWFNRHLREISLPAASQYRIKEHRLDSKDVLRTQEEIRNRILFAMTRAILHYELQPVLQPLFNKERIIGRWEAMDIVWLGNSQETEYQIYYSLSRCTEQRDQFYLVEFHETESSGGGYRIKHRPVDLKPGRQVTYGLLNDQFSGFNLTAS